MRKGTKKQIIFAVFIAMVPTTVLLSAKLTTLLGFSFTVGAYAYAVTFPCTDIIGECFGKDEAKKMVRLGLLAYILSLAFSQAAVHLPSASFWNNQDAYETTLGLVPRIVAGSVLAYYIAQVHDVWAFHFWKKLTNEKLLWLRNNLSTMSSQLIDTSIFVTVAFAGTVPIDNLFSLIVGQYVVKLLIAVVDTPIIYLGVTWVNDDFETKSRIFSTTTGQNE